MSDDWDARLEARTREARNDPRTVHELISLALTEPDENAACEAVTTLHFRGTRDVFEAARELCACECPQERGLGADILGQIGVPHRRFPHESARLLCALLADETDEDVLRSTCIALGHLGDTAAIPSLARLKTHGSVPVRHAVASNLGMLCGDDPLAIDTLIEMMSDPDELVRDWATFGVGSQTDADSPAIRAALFARVSDVDEVTRGEALVGLALRKDRRIIEPLIKELERYPDAEYPCYSIDAAGALADACLLPILTQLKESAGSGDTRLDDVIRRCSEGNE
jgi:HEAT repeat protein